MNQGEITFDKLPEAVSFLIGEVAKLQKMVETLKPATERKKVPIDIIEACKIIGKAKPTVYTLVQKGYIPCYKVGKKLYFYEDELLDWISKNKKSNIEDTRAEIEAKMKMGIKNKPKKYNF